jgi:dihydroxy-acid dehydratase
VLLSADELAARHAALRASGGYRSPRSQTPWQEIQRRMVEQLDRGMVLKGATKYQRISQKPGGVDAPRGVPRDNH